jgi:hypothetical protein
MSQGFDYKVHHRDPKTGRVTKASPYTMKVSKEDGQVLIRGGVRFYPNGDPIQPIEVPVEAEKKTQDAQKKGK